MAYLTLSLSLSLSLTRARARETTCWLGLHGIPRGMGDIKRGIILKYGQIKTAGYESRPRDVVRSGYASPLPTATTDLSLTTHDSRLTTYDLRLAIRLRGGQRVKDGADNAQSEMPRMARKCQTRCPRVIGLRVILPLFRIPARILVPNRTAIIEKR